MFEARLFVPQRRARQTPSHPIFSFSSHPKEPPAVASDTNTTRRMRTLKIK